MHTYLFSYHKCFIIYNWSPTNMALTLDYEILEKYSCTDILEIIIKFNQI